MTMSSQTAPYQISYVEDWNVLATNVAGKGTNSGQKAGLRSL